MANLETALTLLKSGRLREGMEMLEDLMRNEPDNVNVLYNLGMCYSETGSVDKSIETLEKCVRLAPEHSNALTALAFSYSRKGEHDNALAKVKAALEIDPDNFYALKNQGAIFAKLGRYDEAISSMEKAKQLIPDNPEILYGLGLAHKEKGDVKAADELFKTVIQGDKDSKATELAKTARREIGLESLRSKGFRIDAVMYCLGALELLSSKGRQEIFAIVSEIALLGRGGLDINHPDKTYRLNSLKGEYTGLHLLCLMYVGFRIYDESVNIGADLSTEYQAALKLFSNQIDES
jgi:tetratricopeptide (TPR) repeat protein